MKTKIGFYFHCFAPSVGAAVLALSASICQADAPSAGSIELFRRLDADGNGALVAAEVSPEHKRLFDRLLRKADINSDKSLSREEFLVSLVPSRPEKQIEKKLPDSYPQADAVRYVLLTMDTRQDSWIEADEVPEDMQPMYEAMVERLDMNENGSMDRFELARGARALGQIAARYVARERIDVAKELKKFNESQGELAQRFDKPPGPLWGNLGNPRQARKVFKQFDANSDDKLVLDELPPPVQQQFERLILIADRDRDGGLSESEFTVAAERISRFMSRQRPGSPASAPKPDQQARRRVKRPPAGVVPAVEMSEESVPAEEMPAEGP